MNNYMKSRYHRRREEAFELLGGKCQSCSTEDNLCIDHIDPHTKSFPISKMWSVAYSRFLEELKKCQLLCKRCHREKTKVDGSYSKIWETRRSNSMVE